MKLARDESSMSSVKYTFKCIKPTYDQGKVHRCLCPNRRKRQNRNGYTHDRQQRLSESRLNGSDTLLSDEELNTTVVAAKDDEVNPN